MLPNTQSESRPTTFWRALRDLVLTWWRVDQVRVSPRAEKLLTLTPGGVTLIDGMPVEILARTVEPDHDVPRVVYQCRVEGRTARLRVTPKLGPGEPVVEWEFEDDGRASLAGRPHVDD